MKDTTFTRRNRLGWRIMRALVKRGWLCGFELAGFGLAQEGYTDYPDVAPDEFRIRRRGAGPGAA